MRRVWVTPGQTKGPGRKSRRRPYGSSIGIVHPRDDGGSLRPSTRDFSSS
jgi:hypothetical protein